jgi:uncharacterized protein YjfI (DUF2170 family)
MSEDSHRVELAYAELHRLVVMPPGQDLRVQVLREGDQIVVEVSVGTKVMAPVRCVVPAGTEEPRGE